MFKNLVVQRAFRRLHEPFRYALGLRLTKGKRNDVIRLVNHWISCMSLPRAILKMSSTFGIGFLNSKRFWAFVTRDSLRDRPSHCPKTWKWRLVVSNNYNCKHCSWIRTFVWTSAFICRVVYSTIKWVSAHEDFWYSKLLCCSEVKAQPR